MALNLSIGGKSIKFPTFARNLKVALSTKVHRNGLKATNVEDALNYIVENTNDVLGSDGYNSEKPYVVGDQLIHNNKLYRVKVACKGVEPPNATYYEEVNLSTLNTNLVNINEPININVAEGINYTKVGKIVTVSIFGVSASALIDGLSKLPTPDHDIMGECHIFDGTRCYNAYIYKTSIWGIYYYISGNAPSNSIGSGYKVYGSFTYMCK